MKTTKISKRNIMFSTLENATDDVNMAVIFGIKHNFVIDTGIGTDCGRAILQHIGNSKPIIVINTHKDWDHAAGNSVFAGSTIIAHKLAYAAMDEKWDESIERAASNGRYFCGHTTKHLPNMLFDGTIHFPEDGVTIFHSPGHTPCSISVYDSIDKVLHVGDNFGVYEGAAYYWGAKDDVKGFRNMIDIYKQYDFDMCVSGHTAPQNKDVMTMLEAALVRMEADTK